MHLRRPRLGTVALLVIVLAVLAAAWTAWRAWQVNESLTAAAADAQRLEQAITTGDQQRIDAELERLQDHSSAAADQTGGLTWSALTRLPWVGDDARGVRLVSDVVADLSSDGLGPLAESATSLDALLPRGGQVSVAAVRDLQAPVGSAAEALADADARLAGEDPDGFVDRLGDRYRELASQVGDAAAAMESARVALDVLPTMLGEEGPQEYLMVFQNNAEIRATGGLPGAVTILEADDGRIAMTRQIAASSLGQRDTPVLPLTEVEQAMYGNQLGTYFVDANFTPDFPRAADLMTARVEEVHGGDLDGVLSIDPVALSYVLEATGPIRAGDVVLRADNVVDELLHQAYLRYEDPDDQDAFFQEVAEKTFDRISAGGGFAPRRLLTALARGAAEGRIYVHSYDDRAQEELDGTTVAGQFATTPDETPRVDVTLNDTTGAKMSYYLRYSVQVTSTYCQDGVQGLSAHARLRSTAPEDAASLPEYITGGGRYGIDPGDQLVTVRLFAPVGGTIEDFAINAEEFSPDGLDEQGRPVATAYVLLAPGQTVDVTWNMRTGEGQTGETDVRVTPSVEPRDSSSTVTNDCS